ncbi:hypothetical protein L3V83_03805 [Thiotrichales bacterium 19X7-9]|nr:hypothetical protein [Thiotrichales bacterium 19X7-9]
MTDLNLTLISVNQGNGNGKKIPYSDIPNTVLRTTDLVDCIAILIKDDDMCYMIHSDSNTPTGIGKVSLENGLLNLGLSKDKVYSITLIGGQSESALMHKENYIKSILTKAIVESKIPMKDSAYLVNNGITSHIKRDLTTKLGVTNILLDQQTRLPEQIFSKNSNINKSRTPNQVTL